MIFVDSTLAAKLIHSHKANIGNTCTWTRVEIISVLPLYNVQTESIISILFFYVV